MLTGDQIRLRLEQLDCHESDWASNRIIDFLQEVIPEIVEEHARLRRALHLSELSRGMPGIVGSD